MLLLAQLGTNCEVLSSLCYDVQTSHIPGHVMLCSQPSITFMESSLPFVSIGSGRTALPSLFTSPVMHRLACSGHVIASVLTEAEQKSLFCSRKVCLGCF